MSNYGLGRNQLNVDELAAYLIIEEALLQKATTCDISKIKRSVDIRRVLATVLGDNPSIIYINKTQISIVASVFGKKINFIRCMGKTQVLQHETKLQKALEDAVWEIDKKARNDKEILMGISEFLQYNVIYDKDELICNSRGKSKYPESHNAYGALVNHKAVCDGFSNAYALIAQYFGIKCMVVEGKSSYQRNTRVEHAWNIVEYEGEYFHIDATWDTNRYEVIKTYSYDYFGLDDDEISVDHEWDYHKTPKCNSTKLSYYISNNLYAHSEDQIEELISRHIKNQENVIRIKISPSIGLPDETKRYLEGKIMSAASRSGILPAYSYSWQKSTRCLIIIFNR